MSIKCIRDTSCIKNDNIYSLLEDFIIRLNHETDIFTPITVIVPHVSMANYLRDVIAKRCGACININFILLNQFVENLYAAIHPSSTPLQVSSIKYQIYNFLNTINLHHEDFIDVRDAICDTDGQINLLSIYQFAFLFERIIVDYTLLRTKELILQDFMSTLPRWQGIILNHILSNNTRASPIFNFLDSYKLFTQNLSINKCHLPKNIYIFGVMNISVSYLEILTSLSCHTNIWWYQVVPSLEYYYDLLDNKTVDKLRRKILKEPELTIDDLYLLEGNQLIANCGIRSREFNEIMTAYNIDIDELDNPSTPTHTPHSLLELIKSDIHNLINRIHVDKRYSTNDTYYGTPINPHTFIKHDSVKINVCSNKMREIQVMFNSICNILANDNTISISDIIVLAPNIEDYVLYIDAVLSNEKIVNKTSKNEKDGLIPYYICGRPIKNHDEFFSMLIQLITIDYEIKVKDVFEIVNQSKIIANLDLTDNDISKIQTWFTDNHIHFGLASGDYTKYGYGELDLSSFKRLLQNLIYGVMMSPVPIDTPNRAQLENIYIYDNVEFADASLIEKIIKLLNYFEEVRAVFYNSQFEYKPVLVEDIVKLLTNFKENLLSIVKDKELLDKFIYFLINLNLTSQINLSVLKDILDKYIKNPPEVLNFSGKLTFASCGVSRYISYKVTYVLGMNLGEYPRLVRHSHLNILHKATAFADINTTLDDMQIFLDIILSTTDYLYISYISKSHNTGKPINPAVMVNLLIDVIKNSINDETYYCDNIYKEYPTNIVNDITNIYSSFWHNIKIGDNTPNLHWDFTKNNKLYTDIQTPTISIIKIQDILNTYTYTNNGIYKTLSIVDYKNDPELDNDEVFDLLQSNNIKKIYNEFENLYQALVVSTQHIDTIDYLLANKDHICNYLYNKGVLSLNYIASKMQFDIIFNDYITYKNTLGANPLHVTYKNELLGITIQDTIFINNANQIIIPSHFSQFFKTKYKTSAKNQPLDYALQIKGLLYLLLIKHGEIRPDNAGDNIKIDVNNINIILKYDYNEKNDKIVEFSNDTDTLELLLSILDFYKKSHIYPTFIFKGMIENCHKNIDQIIINDYPISSYIDKGVQLKLNQDKIFKNNFNEYFVNKNIDNIAVIHIIKLLINVGLK